MVIFFLPYGKIGFGWAMETKTKHGPNLIKLPNLLAEKSMVKDQYKRQEIKLPCSILLKFKFLSHDLIISFPVDSLKYNNCFSEKLFQKDYTESKSTF